MVASEDKEMKTRNQFHIGFKGLSDRATVGHTCRDNRLATRRAFLRYSGCLVTCLPDERIHTNAGIKELTETNRPGLVYPTFHGSPTLFRLSSDFGERP
ncbi:hypothetical protein RRG08_047810 [Elysia crispata]|uniref:Uncharacterized protein n=1 Tax=Elysia crispata TaxID=231223 RepID=A0AAE0Y3D9_9GAST|nr:hypothetical protein RRG08_047810 [Elysia crispata]